MRRSSLWSAFILVPLFLGLAPGCSAVLGDFSKGPGPADGAVEDSTSSDSEAGDASMAGDSTAPVEAGPSSDSGHQPEASTTDSGPYDAGADGSDGGCGAGNELCSGTCVSLTDPAHCGSCGHDCNTLPNVTGTTGCKAGVCSVPPTSCATGYGHCTSNADDGCETAITTPTNCGACGVVCGANTPLCNSTAGSYSCGTNCGGTTPTYCPATMVCTDLQGDANNCKTCGNICPGTANGSAFCMGGTCGLNCSVGYHLCGSLCLSDSSVSSCGSSCSPCGSVVNGTAGCNGTSCQIASCLTGYANCDGVFADGCNVDTQTDPSNCSACMKVCSLPNASAGCANSACTVASCNSGYDDCDHVASNGCEIDQLTDSNNCGGCGNKCTGGETCSGGSCSCGGGTTLCGSTCTNTQTDGNNCGTCGQVCTGTVCTTGRCTPVVIASGAGEVSGPYDITSDGTNVYWTNYLSSGFVSKVTGATGAGYMTLASALSFPQDITNYKGVVYFTLENAGAGAKLVSVPTSGGTTSVLDSALSWAALNAGANYADGITSDGNGNIYWAFDGGGTYLINKWIVSTSKDNAFENRAYGNIGGIAADATNVVFSEPKNSWMLAAGPPISAFEGGLTNPGRVAAAGGYFYYVVGGNGGTSGTGAIHRAADGTLTSPTTVAAGLNQPVYIATDGANVYWSDTADGAIYRVPVAGGVPFPLVKQAGAAALTTDGTYLYFVNSTTSQILRVPK